MTPTLYGRWQTRSLLTLLIGLPITTFWAGLWQSPLPWGAIALIWGCGLLWDGVYQWAQGFRWDHDWPGLFQLLAGLWEGMLFYELLKPLLSLMGIAFFVPLERGQFWWHYGTVWLGMFLASQSLMRIFFPGWRFRGGQWL